MLLSSQDEWDPLISYEELFFCLRQHDIPYDIRAGYGTLLRVWAEQEFPHFKQGIKTVWSWDEVSGGYVELAPLPLEEYSNSWTQKHREEIVQFILESLDNIDSIHFGNQWTAPETIFVLELLRLVETFARFNAFPSESRAHLMRLLIKLLDPKNDLSGNIPLDKKWVKSELTRMAFQCKIAITDILIIFSDLILQEKVVGRLREFHLQYNKISTPILHETMHTFDIELSELSMIELEKAKVDLGFEEDPKAILLNTTKYHDTRLTNNAFKLLFRYVRPQGTIIAALRKVKLLNDEQIAKTYNKIEQSLVKLSQCTSGGIISKEDLTCIHLIIKEMSSFCLSQGEPRPENQDLLKNAGVHESFIEILTSDEGGADTFELIYQFLGAFCKGNKKNQLALRSHVGFFLSHVSNNA